MIRKYNILLLFFGFLIIIFFVNNNISPNNVSEVSPFEICDFDFDLDCDKQDEKIFDGFIGKCLVPFESSSVQVQADIDSDGCVTEKDRHWLFTE